MPGLLLLHFAAVAVAGAVAMAALQAVAAELLKRNQELGTTLLVQVTSILAPGRTMARAMVEEQPVPALHVPETRRSRNVLLHFVAGAVAMATLQSAAVVELLVQAALILAPGRTMARVMIGEPVPVLHVPETKRNDVETAP